MGCCSYKYWGLAQPPRELAREEPFQADPVSATVTQGSGDLAPQARVSASPAHMPAQPWQGRHCDLQGLIFYEHKRCYAATEKGGMHPHLMCRHQTINLVGACAVVLHHLEFSNAQLRKALARTAVVAAASRTQFDSLNHNPCVTTRRQCWFVAVQSFSPMS